MVQIIYKVGNCCFCSDNLVNKTSICNIEADCKLAFEDWVSTRDTSSHDNCVECDVAWVRRYYCKGLGRLTDEAWKRRVNSVAVLDPECVN